MYERSERIAKLVAGGGYIRWYVLLLCVFSSHHVAHCPHTRYDVVDCITHLFALICTLCTLAHPSPRRSHLTLTNLCVLIAEHNLLTNFPTEFPAAFLHFAHRGSRCGWNWTGTVWLMSRTSQRFIHLCHRYSQQNCMTNGHIIHSWFYGQ